MVYVRVLTVPGPISLGENAMLKPGLAASTVSVALAVPALPSLVDKAPVVLV